MAARWIETELRGKKVFAEINDKGEFVKGENSRIAIVYSLKKGAKIYRANANNLAEPTSEAIQSAVSLDIDGNDKSEPSPNVLKPNPINKHDIVIWTDGACTGNPGPMGIGVVIIKKDERQEFGDFIGKGTNNIAELTAIQRALESIEPEKRKQSIIIHTDSSYCIGVLSKNWKAKANIELIASIKKLIATFSIVSFNKVKGHAGIPDNERCDQLATDAIAQH